MYSSSEILKDVQSQKSKVSNIKDATKYFDKQVNAISWIKDTDGYQEIKKYRLREYDDSVAKAAEVDPNDSWKVALLLAQINSARRFLEFLDNIEHPQGV